VRCIECDKWCHLRCSGLKKVGEVQGFQCPSCKDKNEEEDRKLITTGERIKEVDEFCYLGNVLDCEAGLERAVRARVGSSVENMEGDGEFDSKQNYSIKDKRQCL